MSPGRKPRRSPASTAGRDSTSLSTKPCSSRDTACPTASHVLPVPAGPSANTSSNLRKAAKYWSCAALPRLDYAETLLRPLLAREQKALIRALGDDALDIPFACRLALLHALVKHLK